MFCEEGVVFKKVAAKVYERIANYLHVFSVATLSVFHFQKLDLSLSCDSRCNFPSLTNDRWLAADDELSLPSLLPRCNATMAPLLSRYLVHWLFLTGNDSCMSHSGTTDAQIAGTERKISVFLVDPNHWLTEHTKPARLYKREVGVVCVLQGTAHSCHSRTC